ncbi:MAG: caspase family protein [Marinilabiliales bacterium]|nr:MAG: caspase family protein [Marinilabiliales bacterium]
MTSKVFFLPVTLAALLLQLFCFELTAQATEEIVFATRSGKRGVISIQKNELQDNVLPVSMNLRWVDRELRPVSGVDAVVVIDRQQLSISTPKVSCITGSEVPTRPIVLTPGDNTMRFEFDERFEGGEVSIELPMMFAANSQVASRKQEWEEFAFSRPRRVALEYDISQESIVDLTPPDIRVISPEGVSLGMRPIVDSESVRVSLLVRDNFGIDNVLVNNRPAQMVNDSIYVADVVLRVGYENPVTIIATDNSGHSNREQFSIESRPVGSLTAAARQEAVTSSVREPSDVDINIPDNGLELNNRYALIIGNEDYTSYQPHLQRESNVEFAVHDARIFREYAQKVLGVPDNNIIMLLNARSVEMHNALDRMSMIARNTGGDAEFFIYYAGHGFPDEQTREPYLMPVDVTGANLSFAVPLSDFYSKLTEHPTERITVFIDACFSGGGRDQGLVAARAVRVRPRGPSISGNLVVFSATSGDQSALPYRDQQHGMFTYHLLSMLKASRGEISYRELADHLRQSVATRSVMVNHREQNPETNISPTLDESWENWVFTEF